MKAAVSIYQTLAISFIICFTVQAEEQKLPSFEEPRHESGGKKEEKEGKSNRDIDPETFKKLRKVLATAAEKPELAKIKLEAQEAGRALHQLTHKKIELIDPALAAKLPPPQDVKMPFKGDRGHGRKGFLHGMSPEDKAKLRPLMAELHQDSEMRMAREKFELKWKEFRKLLREEVKAEDPTLLKALDEMKQERRHRSHHLRRNGSKPTPKD